MKKLKSILLLAGLFCYTASIAQQNFKQKLDDYINTLDTAKHLSGVFFIGKEGKSIYEKAIGVANAEKNTAAAMNSFYNIGSVGKMFTAVMVMQLYESGKLDLQKPITSYLKVSFPNADKITLYQLLNHTSGLGNYMLSESYRANAGNLKNLDDLVSVIEKQELVFQTPGDHYSYSNSGFIILGKLIETIYKKPYQAVLEEKILSKAKMKETFYEIKDVNESRKSYPYKYTKGVYTNLINMEPRAASDGGTYTTMSDMFKFDNALRNNVLIKKTTQDLMNKTAVVGDAGNNFKVNYGLGTIIFKDAEDKESGHLGGSAGRFTVFRRQLANSGYTVIVSCNTGNGLLPVVDKILQILNSN